MNRLVSIVDCHSDLLMELVYAERELGETDPFRTRWLPPLRTGGVDLQVCAIWVDPALGPDRALRELLRQARSFHAAVAANGDDVFAVRTAADLDQVGDGRVGLMLAVEGFAPLGDDPALVDVLALLGVRMASLTWNERNAFAGGTDHQDAGLTPLGAEALQRMASHGIAIDVAHTSDRTLAEVLDQIGDAPVLSSHACCRTLFDHPRNLTDEQLVGLAARGGVAGLVPHPFVLDHSGAATLDLFVDHVDHAVATMGPQHVGLGGDFLRQITRAIGEAEEIMEEGLRADAALEELEGPQDYPALAAALRERGYRGEDVDGILGGNLLRLLRRTLPEAGA